MLGELSDLLLGECATEYTYRFFYNLGKWIYLIDALDDYDKDVARSNYNPFYAAYKNKDFSTLIQENGEEISFIMSSTLSCMNESLSQIKFRFNADLIRNIALRGTLVRTKKVLSGEKETKKTKRKQNERY